MTITSVQEVGSVSPKDEGVVKGTSVGKWTGAEGERERIREGPLLSHN